MAIVITIVAALVLTAVAIAVARVGGQRHQEDLSDHHHAGLTRTTADRPAGPDAEPMGVADSGQPSSDPTGEQRG